MIWRASHQHAALRRGNEWARLGPASLFVHFWAPRKLGLQTKTWAEGPSTPDLLWAWIAAASLTSLRSESCLRMEEPETRVHEEGPGP